MKNKEKYFRIWCSLMVVFALIAIFPDAAWAPYTCNDQTDIDCDGFNGNIENSNFPFYGGATAGQLGISMVEQSSPPSINLFYFMNYINNNTSTAPVNVTNHLLYLTNSQSQGGLHLYAHKIPESQVGPVGGSYARQVSTSANSDQKAIRFIEETDDGSYMEDLGSVPGLGTVQDIDYAWVFTNRMRQLIDYYCGAGTADGTNCNPATCQSNPGGNTCGNLFQEMALHTFSHEAGHMLGALAIGQEGGHTRKGTIMDSKIIIKTRGSRTYFYMYNGFNSTDYNGYKVRSSWPAP